MAVEARRGCGYRKVGGLYLVGGGIGVPCDRLPLEIPECSHCKELGIKCGLEQGRGWTWVNVAQFVKGPHVIDHKFDPESTGPVADMLPVVCPEARRQRCTFCAAPELMGKAGLIWIGKQFYETPGEFIAEGVNLGFSRRISTIPKGYKPGETYVLLAHPEAVRKLKPTPLGLGDEAEYKPGVFYIWRPQHIEKICVESQRGSDDVAALEKRGIVPVFVPDNDKDHQGSAYDKISEEEEG